MKKPVKKAMPLTLTLAALGNPDFGERDPDVLCAPFSVACADLRDASVLTQAWIELMGLGSGNLPTVLVADSAGRVVARVSYNARVWAGDGYSPGEEPLLESARLDRDALPALWARITPPHAFEPGPYCSHRPVFDAADAARQPRRAPTGRAARRGVPS